MEKFSLNNDISTVMKVNPNTPRIALSFYLTVNAPEKKPGINSLLNRLFLQGTKNRTSEELAQELEENAIELYSEMKHDFIRFKLLCLNEDFNLGLEILEDIIKNTHFETFDKEVEKLKGELIAELDSPRVKALDNYYKNLYKDHFYGNTYTTILESIDSITKQDIIDTYTDILSSSKKNLCVVGDISMENTKELLDNHFGNLTNNPKKPEELQKPQVTENRIVTIEKEDANQAQIIQGWIFPSLHSDDYSAITLLNTILGSSGLSSRLFLELREKQGLAYTVRSSYETYKLAASFSVYIASEPKNIETCLRGFKKEIDKIKTELISAEELEDAKNNIIGKRQFFTETNILQSSLVGLYESEGLGYDYETKLIEKIKAVTPEKITEIANKYFTKPYVLSVLAPGQYLSTLENVVL